MVEAVSTIIHSFMEEMARSPSHAIRKFSRSLILLIKILIELRFLVALSNFGSAHCITLSTAFNLVEAQGCVQIPQAIAQQT